MTPRRLLTVLAIATVLPQLAACSAAERLSSVGRPPSLSPISSPTEAPGYQPVSMPMPAVREAAASDNSLWRQGSRTFMRDQRAAQVGDIVTVLVSMRDEAQIQNRTERTRQNNESMGMPHLFGLSSAITRLAPNVIDPTKLIDVSSEGSSQGNGSVRRNDSVTMRVAATVTQVLSNGNLVVSGRQETRVNFERRDLLVSGIIRPQDIGSDNTVVHDRLAEARISYGGAGQIMDVQQPRYGQQVLDIVNPF